MEILVNIDFKRVNMFQNIEYGRVPQYDVRLVKFGQVARVEVADDRLGLVRSSKSRREGSEALRRW